jgi:hypothetical protein
VDQPWPAVRPKAAICGLLQIMLPAPHLNATLRTRLSLQSGQAQSLTSNACENIRLIGK